MSDRNAAYFVRFLEASRIVLGLGLAPASRTPEGARAEAPPCTLSELELSASQRERIMSVLQARVPPIRARLKAVRRASAAHRPGAPLPACTAAADASVEIATLRAQTLTEIRRILTPYQRIRLASRQRLQGR